MARNDDELDGCALEFDDPAYHTSDDDVDALVMFADCFDRPDEVEARRADLAEWDAAVRGEG